MSELPTTFPTASPTPASHTNASRTRRLWRRLGMLAISIALVFAFVRWATETRQSGVRLLTAVELRSFEAAAKIYQQDYGAAPTLDALLQADLVDRQVLHHFSRVDPIPGVPLPPSAPIVVQTVPHRAVRKGEPWNGPGEFIDHDLPACRYVLLADWMVVQLEEADFQRDYAAKLLLTPLR